MSNGNQVSQQYSKKYRQILLVTTLVVVVLSICLSVLIPNAGNRQAAPFTFPNDVPLTAWQRVESSPKTQPSDTGSKAWLASHRYSYKQGDSFQDAYRRAITIDMDYEIGSLGNSISYLENRIPIKLKDFQLLDLLQKDLRYREGVGFYSLFIHESRSHLVSCINPHGESTALIPQFLSNRYKADLQPARIVSWLIGQESLQDRRCLWVHMSMPMMQLSLSPDRAKALSDPTFPILEQAWFPWYAWWQQNFPPH